MVYAKNGVHLTKNKKIKIKKKETNMSKVTPVATTKDLSVAAEKIVNKLGMDITKEDIIAAKISQLENSLDEETSVLEKEINSLLNSANELAIKIENAISKEVEATCKKVFPKKIESIKKALEGTLNKVSARDTVYTHSKKPNVDDDTLLLMCHLRITESPGYSDLDIAIEHTKSKEILKLEKDRESIGKQVDEKNEALTLIIQKLRNIPKIERQIKAKLAARVIGNMEGGKAILDLIQLD
jgi:hypothetical protein